MAFDNDNILSMASLFEADFSLDWLIELSGFKASRILSVLEQGVENGLLSRTQPTVYFFKSQYRDTWRERLDIKAMRRYHGDIAAILMRELPDDEAKPSKIAAHLLHIDNDLTGCQWLMAAGQTQLRRFHTKQAIKCFDHILASLTVLQGDQEDMLFIKAAMAYSDNIPGGYSSAMFHSYLRQAKQRAQKQGKPIYSHLIEMHLAKFDRFYAEQGDMDGEGVLSYQNIVLKNNRAMKRFNTAYSKLEVLQNVELITATTVLNTYFLFWQGRFLDVVTVYEKSVPDIQRIPIGHFPTLAAIVVGMCYTMIGQVTQGLGMLNAIRDHYVKKQNLYLVSHASSSIAKALCYIHHFEEARRFLLLSLKEAKESSNARVQEVSTLMLALVYLAKGEKKAARKYLHRVSDPRSGAQGNMLLFPYLLETCWKIKTGELPPMPGFEIESQIRRMLRLNNNFIKGLAYRYQALLAKNLGASGKKIIRSLSLSAKWLDWSGNQFELAQTYFEMARHYLTTRNEKKAKMLIARSAEMLSADKHDLIPDDLRPLMEDRDIQGSILDDIMRLAEQIASKQEDTNILQLIIAAVNRITGAERGAIYLLANHSPPLQLQLRASKNFTQEQNGDPDFAGSMKLIKKVIETGRGCITAVTATDSENSTSDPNEMIRSSVCVPLILRDKPIGVLYHDNRLLSNVFKESDLTLLSFFANLAALELDREKARNEVLLLKTTKEEETHENPWINIETGNYDGIIGTGPIHRNILGQIEQVAQTNAAVLITGETGVGKNLVARAIHRQSGRSSGPFVTVQCSALTESLITSELFGHEKGAFTGATGRRIGRFELAHSGTLFMDEIGDLSMDVQARLLRVLQSKEFERVGSAKTILTSDFRLITATNVDLETEISAGRFRDDLYYRINLFQIHIPSLRERKEDVPLLAHYFLRKHCEYRGLTIRQKDMETLVHYNWPGNVRELENIIQRGLIKSKGATFRLPQFKPVRTVAAPPDDFPSLETMMRRHIQEALVLSGGKVHGRGGAAQILDINPFTLQSKMRKLGIKKPAENVPEILARRSQVQKSH